MEMRLKDLREDHDFTQSELSEKLNIRQNTYSQYENGQRQLPLDILVRLTEIYRTYADYILRLTDERMPYRRTKK